MICINNWRSEHGRLKNDEHLREPVALASVQVSSHEVGGGALGGRYGGGDGGAGGRGGSGGLAGGKR